MVPFAEIVVAFMVGSNKLSWLPAPDPDGTRPDGTRPEGTRPDETRPDGIRPDGTRPDGIRPRERSRLPALRLMERSRSPTRALALFKWV